MRTARRIGEYIVSPCWYLFGGILWVFSLNTYASNGNQIQHWVWLNKELTWHNYCVWSAIGLCFVASLLARFADSNKRQSFLKQEFLSRKYLSIAILGILASALLMIGGYIPRFVFSLFIVVLVSLGVIFFRDRVQISDSETIKEVRRWSSNFLTFVGVILSAFFVVLLLDVQVWGTNFLEMMKTYFATEPNLPSNFLAFYQTTAAPVIAQKAEFSIYGVIAYVIIGCGIIVWDVFGTPNQH